MGRRVISRADFDERGINIPPVSLLEVEVRMFRSRHSTEVVRLGDVFENRDGKLVRAADSVGASVGVVTGTAGNSAPWVFCWTPQNAFEGTAPTETQTPSPISPFWWIIRGEGQ